MSEVEEMPPATMTADAHAAECRAIAVERYDALGFNWEMCNLYWNPTKANRTGIVGAKDGIRQHQGKNHPEWKGYILHMDGLLGIDIDGDNDECKWLDEKCMKSCAMVSKTRKGHHYVFNAHPRIGNYNSQPGGLEIDTKTGNNSILLVAPSFYMHPDHGEVNYMWKLLPKQREDITDLPEEIADWLLERVITADVNPVATAATAVKKSAAVKAPIAEPEGGSLPDGDAIVVSAAVDEINRFCYMLTPEWLSNHSNWLRFMYCLKNLQAAPEFVELADEFREMFVRHSARAPAYNTPAHIKANRKMWNSVNAKGRSGIGSLKYFAKTCNPDAYFANAKNLYKELMYKDDSKSYCEIFYNAMEGDIIYSQSQKCFYIYEEDDTLWRKCENVATVNVRFIGETSAVFNKMIAELRRETRPTDEDERKQLEKKIKTIMRAKKQCDGSKAVALVRDFLPDFCVSSEDPALSFDQNPDLLPLQNGVWVFSEQKLVPYQREHYFTARIPISYNAAANTDLIERAALDWFGHSAEVAEFIQYWVGYCLTGETSRQDFMIVWGTKAGNGKSLLWGTILKTLLAHYYATVTSDALSTERAGNNDTLYNLNGKRFAFLSEPRKGSRFKIDTENVKTLTGDDTFTAEAKYKNAITFKLQAKIAMICNQIPDMNLTEAGMKRRVVVLEQNTEFVDAADFASRDYESKSEHRVKLRDDAFVAALLENKEGLMLWALRGAAAYIADRRKQPPAAMTAAKSKAASETDVLANWIQSNIRNMKASMPKKTNVTLKTIKELLRTQGIHLGQNLSGFERAFKEKVVELGFETGGREGKGDFYIKYAEVVETNDVAEPEADCLADAAA